MLLILTRPGYGTGSYVFPLTNVKISLKILIVKKKKKKNKITIYDVEILE
jgi:hypothetical protein